MSYAISVLVLKRSILTEKIARRGYHLSREYSIDPLEILFAREVMRTNVVVLPAAATAGELHAIALKEPQPRGQYLFPVVDFDRHLKGVITRRELRRFIESNSSAPLETIAREPLTAFRDEPLRSIVMRMAETGITRMPVVDAGGKLEGLVSLRDLLRARVRNLDEERRRERILRLRMPFLLPRERMNDSQPVPSSVRES
jgi:CBS domain-containing protein